MLNTFPAELNVVQLDLIRSIEAVLPSRDCFRMLVDFQNQEFRIVSTGVSRNVYNYCHCPDSVVLDYYCKSDEWILTLPKSIYEAAVKIFGSDVYDDVYPDFLFVDLSASSYDERRSLLQHFSKLALESWLDKAA